MTEHSINRRDLMKVSVLGAAALSLPLERVVRAKSASLLDKKKLPKPYSQAFTRPPVLGPTGSSPTTDYYTITQAPAVKQFIPGFQTPVFAYNGAVPGPTIVASRGRETVVRMINNLPPTHPKWGYVPWTSTHLHGSCSRPEYDGYASDITRPGEYKDYHYPNIQVARTLWYHDHGVGHTAENVYSGLAGQYHLYDSAERALPLPKGYFYDVPLTITDAMFAADGSLMYDDKGHSGLYGDVILVNGTPWPTMRVAKRKYRFRLLNACISRGLMLRLSTGDAMTVVATDGGMMPAPQQVTQLRQGVAERYELVIDFSKYATGQRVELRNLGVKNSIDYDNTGKVMAFQVTDDAFDPSNNEVPAVLDTEAHVMNLTAAQSRKTRKFRVKKDKEIWTIADQTWADVVDSDYRKTFANPGANDIEIWEIENSSGGWNHPVHAHLVDFKVLARNGRAPRREELGPKDTVYIGEGETVRLLMQFEYQTGRYMIHCHNLPHEDHDMMAQFEVGKDGPSPFSAPARPIADMTPLIPLP